MSDKRVITTLLIALWLGAAFVTILTLPDYERYHGRIARTEQLLRTHCSGWSLKKDADYLPAHELLITKCFPKPA